MGEAHKTCPDICPGGAHVKTGPKTFQEAGSARANVSPFAAPYVPGNILPPQAKTYPPDAPPRYLPQPTDSTSGDFLGMGPVGPWAPGHVDWSPQAGMTGVRPVVDKYSITRYSTGQWRTNNEYILTPRATDKAKAMNIQIKNDIKKANDDLDSKVNESNKKLDSRVKELNQWKKRANKAIIAITNEIEALERDRTKLKAAARILMLPEAISRECLELRTHRLEPDMTRDDVEQELINEVAIVGEIRRVFQETLIKVETQMENNKAAKSAMEFDWSDKMVTTKGDNTNLNLTNKSTILQYHPGVVRWTENATTYEFWKHFCQESINNCDEVRKKSEQLRDDMKTIIVNGSQDMKIQADRTNAALAETVAATEGACKHLEKNLKDNLQTIADVENLMVYLTDELQKLEERKKLSMTRIFDRNYNRPNVENCRDDAQYALFAEAKFIKETNESLMDRMRQAQTVRSELMKYRGDLEKEIAVKRKSLNLDADRLLRVRAHMPTPEEFAGA